MKSKFNLTLAQKKGEGKMNNLILVVVILILVAQLAPTALIPFWNTSGGVNSSWYGVPAWVPTTLGLLAVIAFLFIVWKAAQGGK